MKRMFNWFRLRKLESDLDRELKYHTDRRVSDLIQSIKGDQPANLSSALRLFVLGHYQDQISARKNQITTTSPCCSTS